MREQRVTTPDGHVWYVRRRWAKRQPPWKRRADYELSPAERDAVPILTDTDELLGPLMEFFSVDAEVGIFVVLALLALVAVGGPYERSPGRSPTVVSTMSAASSSSLSDPLP